MAMLRIHSGGRTACHEAEPGRNLLSALAGFGYHIPANCGGLGKCGKCRVRLLVGQISGAQPDAEGYFLACLASVSGDAEIEVFETGGSGMTAAGGASGRTFPTDGEEGYGVALDIGTTTLAAYLVELSTGRELAAKSCLNPQGALGADVVSRIGRCSEPEGLATLHKLIVDRTNEILKAFIQEYRVGKIRRLAVAANTTMLHLFAGVDPTPLGAVPFTPPFTEQRTYTGGELGVGAEEVVLLPSVSAYIGSDITAGVLYTGMAESAAPALFIDIGTNGEMVAFSGGQLVSCSTAAGPAFEGANISCGMGGVQGAVNSVRLLEGKLKYTVIGESAAKGICGCGLVDLAAVLLAGGVIDETGAFADRADVKISSLAARLGKDKFLLADGVALEQKDIRELQLAKSAICSGVQTLLDVAGLKAADVETVYIAGGFGFYIDKANAAAIGLYPAEFVDRIVEVGNSSGAGARLCLISAAARAECARIACAMRNIELSEQPDFMDRYVANMFFGD